MCFTFKALRLKRNFHSASCADATGFSPSSSGLSKFMLNAFRPKRMICLRLEEREQILVAPVFARVAEAVRAARIDFQRGALDHLRR